MRERESSRPTVMVMVIQSRIKNWSSGGSSSFFSSCQPGQRMKTISFALAWLHIESERRVLR